MKKHSSSELTALYNESDSVDQEIFAEMRSNILLYSGDHYTKKNSRFYSRIRDAKELSQESKLRLVKNHTQYICDTFVNNIVAPNPGVGFSPHNEKEMHDIKVAQMHHAVWRDAHSKYDIDDKIDDWADNFVQIGEVCTKLYFDPDKGPIKAFNQKLDGENPVYLHPATGETPNAQDEMGQPLPPAPDEEKPIYYGEFCFEEVFGFNLMRPADCKNMAQAAWLGIRKMTDIDELKRKFPEFAKKPATNQDKTFRVFDTARGGYTESKNQALVVEYYFKPCHDYPQGYFYITTNEMILAEGELPGGIFPIVYQAFRKFPTTPRGRSPIKTMRPYQAEINRSASKMAEHQITLGDDKLLIQNGTKISAGIALPGVRSINFSGMDPKILAGRDGSQYLNYMTTQIEEMYRVMGVAEDNEELPAQLDPYSMLFRAARQKKKFQRYIKRFEKFLKKVVSTYLALAKVHFTDDMLIKAIGASEYVNIPEFRSQDELCYEIDIEAQSEDVETKLGKQISITQALQYVGGKLSQGDIGKLLRDLPYGNFDDSMEDLTLDFDNSLNDMLALDRGETPPIGQYDNHQYLVKKLSSRMKRSDFRMLAPQIQSNYQNKIALHQQFIAKQTIAMQRAEQGLIPTGGYMTKCDLYVAGKDANSAPKRVTIPSESIQWLMKQIESQASGLAPLADMPGGAQEQIANMTTGMMGQEPSQPDINRAAMTPALAMG
jgi:hypothetical protein